MVVIGEPKLLRCLAGDAEDKLLAIVKPFTQLKVFKGHTSGDGTRGLPVGKTAVYYSMQVIAKRPGVFGPILGYLAAGVMPKPGIREGIDRCRISFVIGDCYQNAPFSRPSLHAAFRTMWRMLNSMSAIARKPYTPNSAPCEWMGVVLSPCA